MIFPTLQGLLGILVENVYVGPLTYTQIMKQQNSTATYKTGFVASWILSPNLKYKRHVFPAEFGLENICFPQLPGKETWGLFHPKIPGGHPEVWAGVLIRLGLEVPQGSKKQKR